MAGLEGLLEGKVLVNRYRIEQVIGRGGFAAVYSAADERLGRTVAVKVITLAAPDAAMHEQLRERFQREARSAAGLPQHPNVVTVYDFGTDPSTGIDFLVMELLRGEDLASRLAREPRLPLPLALGILREAVEGIAVGHRAGLVHRDVKPGNVFLAERMADEPFRVCVLDFGIARVLAEEGTAARLTQQGSAPLSPAYASPEQLAGQIDLTCASDVFSLGVVAYQLLTGERPFSTERRRGAGGWDVVPLRDRNPDVPQALADVVHRALSYDADARYPDAGAFGEALDAASGTASHGAPASIPVAGAAERTELAPGLAAGAIAGAAAAEAVSHHHAADAADEDDRTLLAAPTPRAAATPVAAAAAAETPPPVIERAPARVAPVSGRKSRAAPIALFAALVVAGGAGAMVWLNHGAKGGEKDGAVSADSVVSAPTSLPAGDGGSAATTTTTTTTTSSDVPVSGPPSGGSSSAPVSVPSSSPAPSSDPAADGSRPAPGASDGGASPASPAPVPASPAPVPASPAPRTGGGGVPAPAAPPSATPHPAPRPAAPAPAPRPTSPAPAPTQAAPAQPAPQPTPPPADTAHMNPAPPPAAAPHDTLKLPPPPPQPTITVPPPGDTAHHG